MALHLDIPLFAGQGTDATNSTHTLQQALRDAASPSGAFLLSSCYDAFQKELVSLSSVELEESGIEPADFQDAKDILHIKSDHYIHNPIISGIRLFLVQSLRYIVHIETSSGSPGRFVDAIKLNASCKIGILGFSSGMLPACVVAASHSTLAYISYSVEAFRLAFYIGLRTQGYRREVLQGGKDASIGLPWSVVLLGMDRLGAQDAIDEFHHKVCS